MTETLTERKTLREWREELGVSQAEIGELAHCSTAVVGQIENGSISQQAYAFKRVLKALGVLGVPEEAIDCNGGAERARGRAEEKAIWVEDGYAATAPKRALADWRAARNLSTSNLAALTGHARKTIEDIERGVPDTVRKTTRVRLARALRVRPNKLILPGDKTPTETEVRLEERLRSELRSVRKALHKAHDFMLDDSNITFKAQEARDALLPDIQRELRGT